MLARIRANTPEGEMKTEEKGGGIAAARLMDTDTYVSSSRVVPGGERRWQEF